MERYQWELIVYDLIGPPKCLEFLIEFSVVLIKWRYGLVASYGWEERIEFSLFDYHDTNQQNVGYTNLNLLNVSSLLPLKTDNSIGEIVPGKLVKMPILSFKS